ncbi:hypothetical protein KQX54_003179 [Cotesia glomerata]|uniref:Uncharacterized protein n=1 Tax=Cotesia glomerata TaxID=32391 RepID=A0AAV7J4R9_COTGL|nr:hypothetical protein KQX54_003179 [Cotesia glomerata]
MLLTFLLLCISCCVTAELQWPENESSNESKTVLDLSNTGVMRLRKSFVNSSLITHLYLTDNNIWKIDEGAFDYLPNLVYLNLTGNLIPLEELNFGGESSIETLILDRAINQHNNLEYYGSNDDCSRVRNYRDQSPNVQNLFTLSISVKLPKLKKLYLRQNNIQSIDLQMVPPLTEIMPNVTHMYLSENSIDSIRFVNYLPATLTHLFLDYNSVTNFEVESLKNLKTLTLDGNQIERLCNSYEYCLGLTLKTAVNLENLSVSRSGLQEIESDAFDNLQNLKKLDVSGNQLHKIVKHTFDNLTNLTTLKLDDNELVTLPDICSLKNLEHLSVANNKIRAISKSTFCGLSKLKVLNFSGNALQEISVGAFDELVALEELDLSKNAFVSLPDEWLSPELSLRRLHLNNNMFKSLASLSLSKSKNLQYINIGDNPLTLIDIKILTTLPENSTIDIGKIASVPIGSPSYCKTLHCKLEYLSNENEPSSENGCVKRVDLSNMGITRLKNNFLKSSTVTRLDLSRNYILKIEDGAFDSLPNLNFVNLTRNLFPFGNLNFTDFSAVETLVLDSSISYIEIKSVYTSFNDFHDDYEVISTRTYHDYEKTIVLLGSMKFFKLKKLYLRKNRIAGINLQDIEALSDVMSSITHLYLNENSLRSVDFLTKFPPTLTHLHLENNQIGSIKTDRSVNSLKVLTVDRNQIESLCGAYQDCYGISMDMFEQLEYFSITYAGLKNISPSSFKYSLALNYLNMSSNAIEIIKDNTFRNLINLETLDLNFNKLQTIPYISDVKNLEYFSIVENGISALDKLNFDGLTNLKILILSHNRLTEIISGTFDELVSLEKLDLSANKLEILSPDWISPKVSLKHLFLNDNSFRSWSSLSLMGIQSLQYVNVTGNPVKLINIRALMTLPENTTVDIGNLNTMNYS